MHINHILEADIIPIGKNIKKDVNRTYTAGPSGFPAGSFADQIASFSRKGKKEVKPVAGPPQIKPFKQLTSYKLEQLLMSKIPFLKDIRDGAFLDVSNIREPDGNLGIQITVSTYTFDKKNIELLSKDMFVNIIEQGIAEIFGDLCIRIERKGMGGFPRYILDANKLGLAAVKPSLHAIIDDIFKEFKITGFGFTWTDKISTGYRTKIEGMELVDSQTFAHLTQRFKTEFGADLIKVTNDKEISRIGHRAVMKGMTNYRLFFGPGIKDKYRK